MKPYHLLSILPLALLLSCGKSTPTPPTPPAPSATAPTPDPLRPRIVSTVPAATLNLILIGATDHLVGVSRYDTLYLPANKKDLPVVGDYQTMNFEQLVSLKPDVLVIQTLASRIEPKLQSVANAHDIELLNMHFESVDDIWTSVLALGKAADMEPQAQFAINNAKAQLTSIAEQYKDAPHPKVAYLVYTNPISLAGGKTFIDEMISAAGATNIGAQAGNGYLDTSRETLIKLAPDVLLIAAPDEPAALENDPRLAPWLSLPIPAANRKRIYLITDGNSLMASIDIGNNVRDLALLIHRGDAP